MSTKEEIRTDPRLEQENNCQKKTHHKVEKEQKIYKMARGGSEGRNVSERRFPGGYNLRGKYKGKGKDISAARH